MFAFARRLAASVVLAGLALSVGPARAAERPPVIAAAADLNAALPDIAAAFARETGGSVNLVFGSSGNFAQQIAQQAAPGGPFELFLSADEGYIEQLRAAGLTEDGGALYAVGRIGLFAPTGSPLRADGELKDLASALRDGRLARFAIANPEHAPYGRAAEQALDHAGLWDAIKPKLVFGENVAQATQFAASGSAQGGIIPLSLALTPALQNAGAFALIPEDWHKPLRQRMVLIRGASGAARAFYAFLQGVEARAIFKRHGFVLPGDGS